MEKICELKEISKKYLDKTVLDKLNLKINKGEMVGIVGASGSGKTTILNIIGLIEKVDNGKVHIFGEDLTRVGGAKLNSLLRNKISYLFQNYGLIDNETIDKNLDVALVYGGKTKDEKKKLKEEAMERVGLKNPIKQKVYQLSGGEQQRVALARIFLKECELILADEPTGSLDEKNRDYILEILKELNKEGKTIVIVTHDKVVADSCSRVIEL